MQDRAASMAESEMVDFLQETSTRLMNGELSGVCLISFGPAGEEYQWWTDSVQAQTSLIGVTGKAWQAMGLEAISEDSEE